MRASVGVLISLVLMACGPKTMAVRLRNAEKMADRAALQLDEADKAMAELEPKKMESALDDAKETLREGDVQLYPEAQLHIDRLRDLVTKLPKVKAERAKRDFELRLNRARDKIVPRVQAMLEAHDALIPTAPTDKAAEALEDRAKAVKDALDDELDLFAQDADFAAWARSQLAKVEKGLDASARAQKGVAFLKGPVVSWNDAVMLERQANGIKAPQDRQSVWNKEKEKLVSCEEGAKRFAQEKATSNVSFAMASGKPQTPSQLEDSCRKLRKSVEAGLQRLSIVLKKAKAPKQVKK